MLPYSVNSVDYEDGPYISPDESFLIFESQRPEGIDGYLGLYISFRSEHGQWGIPVNMGPKINSGKGERFARLSPDGKYLFFGSFRNMSADNRGANIYWIDARVIEELRKDAAAMTKIEQPLGDDLITALDKNDTERSVTLLKHWLSLYPTSLDATVIYSSVLRKQKRYSEAEQLLTTNAASENASIIMEKALIKFAKNQDEQAYILLAPILTKGNQMRSRYLHLSNSLFDMAKFKLSDEYFEKAMVINSHGVHYYNRACRYALTGERDKALEYLNKAAEKGYTSRAQYENDPDLKSLKSDRRFQKLLAKLQ